jgi:hypothetical protein
MALIDNEEAARRLARVIISDIELYEKKKIQAGDDLTAPMAEGRALFHRRVVPELAAIFEAVVEAKRSGAATGGPSALTPPPATIPRNPIATAPALAQVTGAASPDALAQAGAGQARFDEARPIDAVLSESTARADLTAEAAATRDPELSSATGQDREVSQHDRITPVAAEVFVGGRRGAPEASAGPLAGGPPEEAAQERSEAPQDDRVTSPMAFPAVAATDEEPSIEALPSAPPSARSPARLPAHAPVPTPMPVRVPVAAPPVAPLAAAPLLLDLAKASTPQPVPARHEPPPIPPGARDKTPVPVSVSLTAAAPSMRPSVPPSPASPLVALAMPPPDGLAAPVAASASDDVVNLRVKTSKVRILMYVVATAGGLALIGRFLTRFL